MVNIKELARLAGTSISSVSRVINKKPGVNPALRALIERLIREHDYRPNLIARELIQKKTRLVGILLPTIHSYYADRIAGIIDICRAQRYGTMIASARENPEEEIDNLFLMYEKQVEGLIFFATTLTPRHREVIAQISSTMPIVCVGQEIEGTDIPSVETENYRGARAAMEHLIAKGHVDIGFVGGPPANSSARLRHKAFQGVLEEHGIVPPSDWVREGDFTLASGYRATIELMGLPRLPSAVFYANDMMAIGGMRAISEHGLKVPDDISVIGFDDIALAEYTTPPLTTIRQNHYEIGREAGLLLMERLQPDPPPVRRVLLEQSLVERGSVRAR